MNAFKVFGEHDERTLAQMQRCMDTGSAAADPTDDTLRVLNGLWSNGKRLLKNIPPEAGPNPMEGGPGGASRASSMKGTT